MPPQQPKHDPPTYPIEHPLLNGVWPPYYWEYNYLPYAPEDRPVEEYTAFDTRMPNRTTPPTTGIPGIWLPRGMDQNAGQENYLSQDTDYPPSNPGYNRFPTHGTYYFGYEPVVQGELFGDIDKDYREGDDTPDWVNETGGWPRFYPRRIYSWGFVDIGGGVGGNIGMSYAWSSNVDYRGQPISNGDTSYWNNNAYLSTGYPACCILRGYKLWMLTSAVLMDNEAPGLVETPATVSQKAHWWKESGYGEAIQVADIRETRADPTLQQGPVVFYPQATDFECEWQGLIKGQFFGRVDTDDIAYVGINDGNPHAVNVATEVPGVLRSAHRSRCGDDTFIGRAPLVPAKSYGVGLDCMVFCGAGPQVQTLADGGPSGRRGAVDVWICYPYQGPEVFRGVVRQAADNPSGNPPTTPAEYRDPRCAWQEKFEIWNNNGDEKDISDDIVEPFDTYAFIQQVAHRDAPYCVGMTPDQNKLYAGRLDPFYQTQVDLGTPGSFDPHVYCLRDDKKTLIEQLDELDPDYDEKWPLVIRDYDRRPENSLHGPREVVLWTKGVNTQNLIHTNYGVGGVEYIPGLWFASPWIHSAGVWWAEYPKHDDTEHPDKHVPIKVRKYDITTEDFYSDPAPTVPPEGWPALADMPILSPGQKRYHCPVAISLTPYGDFVTVSTGWYPNPADGRWDFHWFVERHGHWKHHVRMPYQYHYSVPGNRNRFLDSWVGFSNADQYRLHLDTTEQHLHLRNFPARCLNNHPFVGVSRGTPGKREPDGYSNYASKEFVKYSEDEDEILLPMPDWAGEETYSEEAENVANEWTVDLATGKVRVPWRTSYGPKMNPFRVDSIDNELDQAQIAGQFPPPEGIPTERYTGPESAPDVPDIVHVNTAGCGALAAHVLLPDENLPKGSSAPPHFF